MYVGRFKNYMIHKNRYCSTKWKCQIKSRSGSCKDHSLHIEIVNNKKIQGIIKYDNIKLLRKKRFESYAHSILKKIKILCNEGLCTSLG